jgi:methylated-DNA-[protein]-cysteine S-methyltransferase
MCPKDFFYTLFPSDFGILGIIWQQPPRGFCVHRIFLPCDHKRLKSLISQRYPQSKPGFCSAVDTLGKKIIYYFKGVPCTFPLQNLAFEQCSPFQKKVLLAEYQVPRGWVTTYGRIASHLQIPGGARAVGGALSHNPFPIVIPCHRTIKSSGDIGGFGGELPGFSLGSKLKQILLKLEGVTVSAQGKVINPHFYY